MKNPTDDQLNAAFAEKICGWTADDDGYGVETLYYSKKAPYKNHGAVRDNQFTKSADLVFPWLYKRPEYCELQKGATGIWTCVIGSAGAPSWSHADRDNPAKCIVIALLRAHGIEVEFA